MLKKSRYIITGITLWRILMAPVIIFLAVKGLAHWFKWFLALSFFTDAIDGTLARRYHVTGKMGAKLDSIGDDLTILAAFVGMVIFQFDFVLKQLNVLIVLAALYVLQVTLALYRYRKLTAFHTYLAKAAAIFQALFLLGLFFWPGMPIGYFYTAAILTALDLVEEIILVLLLPKWEQDVRGLYWVMRRASGNKK